MAKNKVNDNGLENVILVLIRNWYYRKNEINKLVKKQERCAISMKAEPSIIDKQGYIRE